VKIWRSHRYRIKGREIAWWWRIVGDLVPGPLKQGEIEGSDEDLFANALFDQTAWIPDSKAF